MAQRFDPEWDKFPPPPPEAEEGRKWERKEWCDRVDITYPRSCLACKNVMDKHLRKFLKPMCEYKGRCLFAHSIEQMQTPMGYSLHAPVPRPKELNAPRVFNGPDWGSRHTEDPLLHFDFEDLYPTKATNHAKELLLGREKEFIRKYQDGVAVKLCYSFTIHQKCSFWENCDYIHAAKDAIDRECQRTQCKCSRDRNGAGTRCRKTNCPYAHTLGQLKVRAAFLQPAFEDELLASSNMTLYFSGKEVTIRKKYIACAGCQNSRDGAAKLCTDPWCNDESCSKGVHLLPSAWVNGGEAFPKDQPAPDMPLSLAKHVKEEEQRIASAGGAASPSARNTAATKTVAAGSAAASAASAANPDAAAGAATSKANHQMIPSATAAIHPPQVPAANHSQSSIFSGTVSLPPLPEQAADEEGEDVTGEDFLQLLQLGPPQLGGTPVEFRPVNLPETEDSETLRDRWGEGTSERYHELYLQWLGSRQLMKAFTSLGVVTHSTLIIGEGSYADVYLGLCEADGREVAIKVYKETRETDKHFVQEREALKENFAIDGTVKSLTSGQLEGEKYGRPIYTKVTIMELMEGSLADAMNQWTLSQVHAPSHLRLTRYVIGSLLTTLLALNYRGLKNDLVHRDVKPDNIMVDRNKLIRLIDFGTSRSIGKLKDSKTGTQGTSIVGTYASPEAQEDPPRAHKTSDLFSVGQVLRALLRGRVKLPDSFSPEEVPEKWPSHRRHACEGLLEQLLQPDPNKRAFFNLLDSRVKRLTPHGLVLSHPFFWSARTCNNFLVCLGNFKRMPQWMMPDLESAIKRCYSEESWFDVPGVAELAQPDFDDSLDKTSPFQLVRFIRNKQTHVVDNSMPPAIRAKLLDRPVFLELFPRLVVECWSCLLKYLPLGYLTRELIPFEEFYSRTFNIDEFRDTTDDEAWW